MALTPCRECGREVSAAAASCPQCGVPNPTLVEPAPINAPAAPVVKQRNKARDLFLGMVVLIVIGVVFGRINDASHSNATLSPEEASRRNAAEAQAKAKKEADCRQDLQCWGDKGAITATVYCRDKIEKLANYSMKWTDSWYEQKFSRFRWSSSSSRDKGVVTYVGDKAQFQNGFGAFQNMIYTCDMIPDDKERRVLDVSVKPGRLD